MILMKCSRLAALALLRVRRGGIEDSNSLQCHITFWDSSAGNSFQCTVVVLKTCAHSSCRGGRVVAGYWSLGATREVRWGGGFVLSAGLLDAGSGLGMDLTGDVCVKGCIAVIAAGYITCSTMPAAP